MKIIGVTGPSGAGKSVFCGYLRDAGCVILDCDEIYHRLISAPSACTEELSAPEQFGKEILNGDGSVNRRALAAIVFAPGNEARLELLNHISHRHVTAFIQKELQKYADSRTAPAAVIIDAPLLFQAGMETICDKTVALTAVRNTRMNRLSERDGLDTESLNARLNAAPDDTYYTARADFVIVNDGDLSALERKARMLLRRLRCKPIQS